MQLNKRASLKIYQNFFFEKNLSLEDAKNFLKRDKLRIINLRHPLVYHTSQMVEKAFQVIFRSSLARTHLSLWHKITFWPIVAVKQSIHFVYNFLLSIIWNQVKGRKYDGGPFGILFLLGIAVISLLTFFLIKYNQLFFVIFLISWLTDLLFATYQYENKLNQIHISLQQKGNEFLYNSYRNWTKESRKVSFELQDISQLSIQSSEILGGAYQSKLATIWQLSLDVHRQERLILFEHKQIERVFKRAEELAKSLNDTPIRFLHSEGCAAYAQQAIDLREGITCWKKNVHTIKISKNLVQKNQDKFIEWIIVAEWNLVSFLRSIEQAFHHLIPALSLVFLISCMSYLGSILIFIGFSNGGLFDLGPSILLNGSTDLFQVLRSFNASIDWTDSLEIILIILLIFCREFEISQKETLRIDDESIRFALNDKLEAQLKVSEIKTVVWVKEPNPIILIVSSAKVIQIPGLQTEDEFKALLLSLFFVLCSKKVIPEAQMPRDVSFNLILPVLEETLESLYGRSWRAA